MNRLKLASCVAVCLLGGLMGQAVLAHGGGHGGGGHGGGHSGGHMGGHSGGHHYGGGGYGGGYGGGFYGGGIGLYGLGGYGYGSGYGNGYGYGSSYYGNQGYYAQPVQAYPNYSTQQYAVPVGPALPAPDGGEIVLFLPADVADGVQYTLNGQSYLMKPGESQRLTNDRRWTIEFAPTSGGQIALRYSLLTGRYKFKPSGSGMGLFETQDMPTAQTTTPPTPNPPAN